MKEKKKELSAMHKSFAHELAQYLVGNQASMSIRLEMGEPAAKAWAKLRSTTPLSGYPTVIEAEKQLTEWLFNG
jgi:hypothetical protein